MSRAEVLLFTLTALTLCFLAHGGMDICSLYTVFSGCCPKQTACVILPPSKGQIANRNGALRVRHEIWCHHSLLAILVPPQSLGHQGGLLALFGRLMCDTI